MLPAPYQGGDSRLARLLHVPTSEELRMQMFVRPVPPGSELWTADASQRVVALANLPRGFLPFKNTVTFVESVLAGVRDGIVARNFADNRYRRLYYGSSDVLQGRPPRSLPPGPASLVRTGFTLSGPSQTGRTALLQRIRERLGEHFQEQFESPGPALMSVIPMVYLRFPACGTVAGLLEDLRHGLARELGAEGAPANAFADIRGSAGPNMAIALCTSLNVGLLVVDGACAESLETGRPRDVLAYLEYFQQSSGIPVLLSGTSAFMHVVEQTGSKGSNLLGGVSLHMEPLPPPPSGVDIAEKEIRCIWSQICRWYWACGVLPPEQVMPSELPTWTYKVCVGRCGWLAKGFVALLTKLIKTPTLLNPGELTEAVVSETFEIALSLQSEARRVAAECMETGTVVDEADFYNYMDHLPNSVFCSKRYRNWLSGSRR
ncbi:AAA family ATPase [Ralstonia chuxiongensis]|uniref:AAA family ATPase n=1 Tax=Ralstonia chuxiongensis TaxID=2957504 RepID=UPI0028F65534|nr:AAA family ATPase [Ralstonia chuxiongensis]CAJ0783803.1 hypothetical protein R8510_05177 [Ralstonia chuxiongensis]